MEIRKLRHVGFSVKNEAKALYFYCNLLGFKVIGKEKLDENFSNKVLKIKNLDCVKLSKGNILLELYIMPRDFEKGRWNHISLEVDNIDTTYTTLLDSKIKFLSEPVVSPTGKYKLCFCRDCDGNLIELVEKLGVVGSKRPQIKVSKAPKNPSKSVEKPEKRVVSPSLRQRINTKNKTISEAEVNKEYSESK